MEYLIGYALGFSSSLALVMYVWIRRSINQ